MLSTRTSSEKSTDDDEDFDAIYNNPQEKKVDVKKHGSVLMHLISQVSFGMSLGNVTLPAFILERRSLLEMYAEFFAHPDDFVGAVELLTSEDRFLNVVKYYMNSFYPARKSGVAKKPYNPILGEHFRCRWTLPGTEPAALKTRKGPFPGSGINQLTFLAEQVSHHPPKSAFYAEHPERRISFTCHIQTKSVFQGLSVAAQHIGSGTLTLHNFAESYIVTFPTAYGRSIMTKPWIELGGEVQIRCAKTQFRADINFLTKPLIGGKRHQVKGDLYRGKDKEPFAHFKGEWRGQIHMRRGKNGDYKLFTDVLAKPDLQKECLLVKQQGSKESRRLWRRVTAALFRNNIEEATLAKQLIEQRQRDARAERERHSQEWTARFFTPDDVGGWQFKESLEARLQSGEI